MNKHWKALVALGLLAVVAGGFYWYENGGANSLGKPVASGGGNAKPVAPPAGSSAAVPVEVAKVKIEAAKRTTNAVGTFRSFESIVVRPEIAGRIVSFNFKEGQKVTAGQVLVQLDDTLEKANLAQAKSQLDLAKSNFDRAQTLVARNVGTGKALDEARAQLQSSTAAVDLAQARLEKMTLVAPFAGTIGLRKVSIGDYLAPGAEIVNLEQIDPLKIDFRVPEIFLPVVKIGAQISVQADAFPGRFFTGEIYAINPLVDEAGRSVVLRARIANPDDVLRPGLFARIDVTLAVRERSIFIPEQSIVPVGKETFVYKVVDAKAVLTKVTLGLRRTAQVEVVEGLNEGDTVVTGGLLKIRDGSDVAVVPGVTSTDIAPRTGAQPGNTPPPAAAPAPAPAPSKTN
ncbi:MAG: efflux RND transporter periplasmic adaptor subunit [Rhodospirillales bacterium]